jgi:hypothetical protein
MCGVLKASLFCYTLFMTRTNDEGSWVPVTATTAAVQMLKRHVQPWLWVFWLWESSVLSVNEK